MKGFCGIDIDKDKIFISFAALRNGRLDFIKEIEMNNAAKEQSFLDCFRKNSEMMNQKIIDTEKDSSLKVEKIFLDLPWSIGNRKLVEDIIPFKKRKRICPQDLFYTKKYLSDIFLDWDDFCIHNFIFSYEMEGNLYNELPLGMKGKKLKVKALLVWVKDKFHKEITDIFDNLDREFGGFVSDDIGSLSTSFMEEDVQKDRKNILCAVNIGYEKSYFIVYKEGVLQVGKEFDFGSKKIMQAIEKRFLLDFSVTEEVFSRYVSFQPAPYYKEVSIKKGNSYVSLSAQALNSFIREYIKQEISFMIVKIKAEIGPAGFSIAFIGRLSGKEGFDSFLREFIPQDINIFSSLEHKSVSSSFGCLKYGVFRFWEDVYKKRHPLFERILNVYKEYF